MLDIILWPVKAWYTLLLVILIADKIVAITPVPWDDLIVTSAKKITQLIQSAIDNIISYIAVKPVKWFIGLSQSDNEVQTAENEESNDG